MLSVVGTAVIAFAIKAVIGLRPSVEDEESGLDDTDHGEAGYHPDEVGMHEEIPVTEGLGTAPARVVKPASLLAPKA